MANFWDAFDKPPPPERPATLTVVPPPTDNRYAAAALRDECAIVATAPQGTRNHALNRAAFSLGQLVAAGHLDHQVAWDALTDAATQAGLDPREIHLTLRSGLGAGQQHPRQIQPQEEPSWVASLTPFAPDTDTPGAEPDATDAGSLVRQRLPIIDWHHLWADDQEEDWILEPLLPARRLIALYSAPKVGKSLLLLELAVAISRGTPALGTTIDRARRVLYVDFENDPRGDVRERLQAMGMQPGQLDNLCYLSFPTIAGLDSENGSLELLAAIAEYACEVVVIDTVSRSVQGEENENDTWLNFYRHTGLKLKQAGVAMIRLDHTGKDESKGQRGGSAKVGDVDAVWFMSKVSDDVFQLTCEANRMPIAEKTLVLHREQGPLRHRVDGGGAGAAWTATVNAVVAALDAAGAPKDTGRNKAREIVRAAGLAAGTKALEEAVKRRKAALEPWGQVDSGRLPPTQGAGIGQAVNETPVTVASQRVDLPSDGRGQAGAGASGHLPSGPPSLTGGQGGSAEGSDDEGDMVPDVRKILGRGR